MFQITDMTINTQKKRNQIAAAYLLKAFNCTNIIYLCFLELILFIVGSFK